MNSHQLKELRGEVDTALAAFIEADNRYLTAIGPELNPVADALKNFVLDGGKRFRPLFALVGFLGTGQELNPKIVSALSSLELIHVCALIHDDVMDGSHTRRGAPAIHKLFEGMHSRSALSGSSSQFGVASAILLGDLALVWAAKMFHESAIDPDRLVAGLPIFDEMQVELMAGQYLDIYEGALASESVERSLKVARYKSGKYSIERPLHFGAALGAASPADYFSAYSEYGLPLGEAFQLRDDLLGVFGDPAETGKPAGDDLREGKRTVLMALTHDLATSEQRQKISTYFGKEDIGLEGVEVIREIIIATGARDHCEELITKLRTQSLAALDHESIAPSARDLLSQMADIATRRTV